MNPDVVYGVLVATSLLLGCLTGRRVSRHLRTSSVGRVVMDREAREREVNERYAVAIAGFAAVMGWDARDMTPARWERFRALEATDFDSDRAAVLLVCRRHAQMKGKRR